MKNNHFTILLLCVFFGINVACEEDEQPSIVVDSYEDETESKPDTEPKPNEIITTAEAGSVTISSAILYGYIDTDRIEGNYNFGIMFSDSEMPNVSNSKMIYSYEVDGKNKFYVEVNKLTPATTYYYKAFLEQNILKVGEVKSFTTNTYGVPVDLGLNVYWADRNLGANQPEELGDYYAWGEVWPKTEYSILNYKWYKWTDGKYTKYVTSSNYGKIDNITELLPEDDAVIQNELWGKKWRMPTYEDLVQLCDNCDIIEHTVSGQSGYLFTSKKNGQRIFFPAGGEIDYEGLKDSNHIRYWSSTLYTNLPFDAYCLYSGTNITVPREYNGGRRYDGMLIRPVMDKK